MAQAPTFRTSHPKRTRVLNVKQSRGGCSTCKARRVKCDERKPICQRCERADRNCEYGQKRAVSTVSRSSSSSNPAFSSGVSIGPTYEDLHMYNISPNYALSDGIWQNPEQSRLASLGCWVLSNDPMIDSIAVASSSVWLQLLPQLVHSTRTAYASAAAFGAVYESCLVFTDPKISEGQTSVLYSNALSVLQEDLNKIPSGTAPLLLSCILLACFEVVKRRRGNALRHLEGAFKVLEISDDESLCKTPGNATTPSTENLCSSSASPSSPFVPKKDDLFLLLKTLDLQTSTYALSRAPYFPPSPDDDDQFQFVSVRGADLQLTTCLHNVHHFTSRAYELKYTPPSTIPRETSIEQGRQIAHLSLWLKRLDSTVLHPHHDLSPPAHRHALMLRAQCLVAIIYVSTILCPYETEYDRHASYFQQIIEAASVVVDAKTKSTIKFRPGLGIMQPLFFTAIKYRHSWWRQQAIALLLRAGVEGPWVGRVEAAMARRVAEVEEETAKLTLAEGQEITPEMIPERKRVCGETLVEDYYEESTKTNKLRGSLSRCVDVEYMISGREGFESPKHWNIWMEDIEVQFNDNEIV